MSEQELIEKYFSQHQTACESVQVSVGDDAAIVNPPKESRLVITTDTLNSGIHFFTDSNAKFLGHKSLAVSLSDIAAMGAMPLWSTLNLSLPEIDHEWLKNFSDGLYEQADAHNVKIVGGDIVRGPLSITVTIIGYLKLEQHLLRSNCEINDLIYVTGYLGDAAFGLKLLKDNINIDKKDREYFLTHFQQPKPRLDVSQHLANISKSAIDISDGFLLDMHRMLSMSKKGAVIDVNKIPISKPLEKYLNQFITLDEVLTGGEDYELIFTIKPDDKDKLENCFSEHKIIITQIGEIVTGSSMNLLRDNTPINLPKHFGFDHFS